MKTVQALGLVVLVFALAMGFVVMLMGFLRCREVWVRRTVNRRSVVALLVALLGWLLIYVGGALTFTVYRGLFWPLLGCAVVCFGLGVWVALSGLAQMRRHPKWFNYGRGHALAAIWGAVVPLGAMVALSGAMLWFYRSDLGMLRSRALGYYESESFGYRVNLAGGLWKKWEDDAARIAGAEFAVLGLMGDQGLFVLPVSLAGQGEVDMGGLADALLAEVGQKVGDPRLKSVPASGGTASGERHFSIFLPKERSGVSYFYRVAATGGMGYLIGAWMDQRQGASQERLGEAVMRVSLAGAGGKRKGVSEGVVDSAALQARIYRRMAAYLTRHGLTKDAQRWASEADKRDGGVGEVGARPVSGGGLAAAIFALEFGGGARALELSSSVARSEATNHAAVAIKAIALGQVGKVGEGLRAVELAQKTAPENPSLGAAADFLRALKAEDAGVALDVAMDPVPVPGALLKVEEPSEAAKAAGVGYDWTVTALRFQRGEPLVWSRYGRVRVLSAAGAKAFPRIVETFDPAVELPHINRAVVADGKGKELRKIGASAWRVEEGEGGGRQARLVADVGELGDGDAVEWVVTFRRGWPVFSMPFWSHCFSRELAVRRSVLWMDGDFQSMAATSSRGVPRPIGQPLPHWILDNPPPEPVAERFLPSDELYLPHVWLGEGDRDWVSLASDYLDLWGGALAQDETVRGEAEKAVSGAEGVDAKVAALARFVQSGVRAARLGSGSRNRVPPRSGDILSAREGDSTAHAALLHALLSAAGVESFLAMVRVGGPIHEGIPALEQFDRMLVSVPSLAQQFVDAYEKDGDPMGGLSAVVAGRRALVLDPKGPRMVDVPSASMIAAIRMSRRVRLSDGGEMEIEEQAEITGAMPRILAERIGWGGKPSGFAEAFLAEAKGVTVKGLEVGGGGHQGPVKIKVLAVGRPGGGEVRIPALLETLILDPGPAAGRRGPAWLGSAVTIRGSLEVIRGGAPVPVIKPKTNLVGRRLVGCAFAGSGGFVYAVERLPGLLTAENFQTLWAEAREVIGAIEPRTGASGESGR